MYDKPMTQQEVDKMIEKSSKENIEDSKRQMSGTGSIMIIEGPFKGISGRVCRKSNDEKY